MLENDVNVDHVSEIELVYKRKISPALSPKVTASQDAYILLLQSWDENKIDFIEQAKILLLNRANRVLGICDISTGGTTATIVDSRLVFAAALKTNACSIILAHNHPTGNLTPSQADKNLTENFMEAGKILQIPVLDHLIISNEGYYSFSEDTTHPNNQKHLPLMDCDF